MKKVVKNMVVTIIVIATTIVVANWTIVQLEEGYSPSYPHKLDKQWNKIGAMYYVYYEYI